MANLEITLVKSLIGRKPNHIVIANTLGLRKLNKTVVLPNNPSVRGMINKINYLLNVRECK